MTYAQSCRGEPYRQVAQKGVTSGNGTYGKSVSAQKQALMQSYQATGHTSQRPGASQTGSTKVGSVATTNKLRMGRTGTGPADYKIGDVVMIAHVEPNLDPDADLTDPCIAWADETGPISAKFRRAIVVQIHAELMKVIPVYTSKGKGLDAKPWSVRQHCVMLQKTTNESSCLTSVGDKDYLTINTQAPLASNAYINLVSDFPVVYGCPIKKEGELTKPSCQRLLKMYTMWFMMATTGKQPTAAKPPNDDGWTTVTQNRADKRRSMMTGPTSRRYG